MAFPVSPVDGQTYKNKEWNSSSGAWVDFSKQVLSGQVGTSGVQGAGKVLFNEFWTNIGNITYDPTTRRFTVGRSGSYRIAMNCFINANTATRIKIGVNEDAPSNTSHKGHVYSGITTTYEVAPFDTVVDLVAGDYFVFYIEHGQLYNQSHDQFNQFSIERVA